MTVLVYLPGGQLVGAMHCSNRQTVYGNQVIVKTQLFDKMVLWIGAKGVGATHEPFY